MKVYLVNLEKQAAYAGYTQKLVFWSGVTEDQAKSFATKNKRFTVGMLIQSKTDWDMYKKPKSEGGHWKDWAETFQMFWDPISEVMAELAQGDVYAYFTEQRAVEQKDLEKCQAVWCRIEKSILVQSLKGKRVKSIAKYVLYKNGSTKQDGFIKTIAA
ncbi:ankyrin repeat protein, partial [Metarhizium majus ARSEF 297]